MIFRASVHFETRVVRCLSAESVFPNNHALKNMICSSGSASSEKLSFFYLNILNFEH